MCATEPQPVLERKVNMYRIHLEEAVLRFMGKGGVAYTGEEQEVFLYPWESEGCAGSGSGVTD